MAEILERPLTVAEAAARSGRHINTIRRWIASGQLKTLDPSPLDDKHKPGRAGRRIDPQQLALSCSKKLVPFKHPRRPHLLRKREKDRERWQRKYANGKGGMREYKREYMRWYSKTPKNKAWRKAYEKKRRDAKKVVK